MSYLVYMFIKVSSSKVAVWWVFVWDKNVLLFIPIWRGLSTYICRSYFFMFLPSFWPSSQTVSHCSWLILDLYLYSPLLPGSMKAWSSSHGNAFFFFFTTFSVFQGHTCSAAVHFSYCHDSVGNCLIKDHIVLSHSVFIDNFTLQKKRGGSMAGVREPWMFEPLFVQLICDFKTCGEKPNYYFHLMEYCYSELLGQTTSYSLGVFQGTSLFNDQ